MRVTASSGTDTPLAVLTKIFVSALALVWNSGLLSRILARAEGVEHLLADLVDRHAVHRRLLAVDLHAHLRIGDGKVAVDVAQAFRSFRAARSSPAQSC